MASLKECHKCKTTFYGDRNICLNCRDKERVEEAKEFADWVTQYDNCYGRDNKGNWV